MSFQPFETMVGDARPYPSLRRLLAGVMTVVVVMFAWIVAVNYLLALRTGQSFAGALGSVLDLSNPSPGGTAIYLFLVVGLGLGAVIAARFWQKRLPSSLTGPMRRTIRHFAISAGVSAAVIAAFAVALLPVTGPLQVNLDPAIWLTWLPIGILVLLAQTGSEELLFRGYLQSQFAARFRSQAIWLGVPALLFGAVHYLPGVPVTQALSIVVVVAFFGLLAGDLTARTGSIGAAWGFHFSNNALVVLFVSSQGSLTGLALCRTQASFTELTSVTPLIALEILAMAAIWVLIRRVMRI